VRAVSANLLKYRSEEHGWMSGEDNYESEIGVHVIAIVVALVGVVIFFILTVAALTWASHH
jgi:hypothetical protein